jgi:hypothetical protein
VVKALLLPREHPRRKEMHENPGATEQEQELARTKRMDEEEAMRGGNAPGDEGSAEDGTDAEDE